MVGIFGGDFILYFLKPKSNRHGVSASISGSVYDSLGIVSNGLKVLVALVIALMMLLELVTFLIE